MTHSKYRYNDTTVAHTWRARHTTVRVEIHHRTSFGLGAKVTRNGEPDLRIAVYLGPLLSIWVSVSTPALRWLRVDRDTGQTADGVRWHEERETGIVLSTSSPWIDLPIERPTMSWSTEHHWWRRLEVNSLLLSGRWRIWTDRTKLPNATVTLPEGDYTVKLTQVESTTTPRTLRGRIRSLSRPQPINRYVNADVDGGIPVYDKRGWDGIWGTSGGTPQEALDNLQRAVLRDRKKYGWPYDLPHPMTSAEAKRWDLDRKSATR